ncbi:Putative inner membrane protein [hydrothermal vent metagenome]|uniref:Putative inner membrane protein n=1 Tax=hydrothermal vent metagenome TaxID=652676 RepID=A0A1W1BA37_9ZZZZ
MKKYILIVMIVISIFTQLHAQNNEANMTQEEVEKVYYQAIAKIWDSFNKQKGDIELPNGVATLHVPDDFFYLNPEDSEKMLVQIWGNPPSSSHTLGMLFPNDSNEVDSNTWGVTIQYQEDGYVSDDNAEDIDYDELLKDMQNSTEESNEHRKSQGYEAIHLVGWASTPYYDNIAKKLHWAQELQFGTQPNHTLNYNIRILGRKGVLILNFIANMNQLPMIKKRIDTVLNIAEFNKGSRYADFDPDIDEVAAYGIGALIAGKVAAKLGLFATLLILLKKFWIIAILTVGGFFKKIFGGKE